MGHGCTGHTRGATIKLGDSRNVIPRNICPGHEPRKISRRVQHPIQCSQCPFSHVLPSPVRLFQESRRPQWPRGHPLHPGRSLWVTIQTYNAQRLNRVPLDSAHAAPTNSFDPIAIQKQARFAVAPVLSTSSAHPKGEGSPPESAAETVNDPASGKFTFSFCCHPRSTGSCSLQEIEGNGCLD